MACGWVLAESAVEKVIGVCALQGTVMAGGPRRSLIRWTWPIISITLFLQPGKAREQRGGVVGNIDCGSRHERLLTTYARRIARKGEFGLAKRLYGEAYITVRSARDSVGSVGKRAMVN